MGSPRENAGTFAPGRNGIGVTRRDVLAIAALGLAAGAPGIARAAPQGQLIWGVHISLAPIWFDPADTSGIITPFMVLYAIPAALVKPVPRQPLASNWSWRPSTGTGARRRTSSGWCCG